MQKLINLRTQLLSINIFAQIFCTCISFFFVSTEAIFELPLNILGLIFAQARMLLRLLLSTCMLQKSYCNENTKDAFLLNIVW